MSQIINLRRWGFANFAPELAVWSVSKGWVDGRLALNADAIAAKPRATRYNVTPFFEPPIWPEDAVFNPLITKG